MFYSVLFFILSKSWHFEKSTYLHITEELFIKHSWEKYYVFRAKTVPGAFILGQSL